MDHINSPSYLDDIAMTSTFCLILELAPSGSNLKMSFILPASASQRGAKRFPPTTFKPERPAHAFYLCMSSHPV